MSVLTVDSQTEDFVAGCYAPETQRDDMDMTTLIEDHLDHLEGKASEATIRDRRRVLLAAHRELPNGLDDVYTADLKAFLANPDWKRWTVRTYYTHLVAFYRDAYASGWMTMDPMVALKPPPTGLLRPKPITSLEEIRLAFERSPEPWHACIMLGIGAGLRSSELAAIRKEDVTPEFVHVRDGKGGKERYIDTCESLWKWVCDQPGGLLVRWADGRPVTGRQLSARQRRHWVSIGLPSWHLHRFRHTFCTTMWRQPGADPLVVRDLMGHVSVSTTQGYYEPDRAEYRHAVSAVDVLLRASKRTPAGA